MNKTWLVAKETYRQEVKNWSFLLMIFAPFIVFMISFFFEANTSSAFDTNTKVGIISQNKNVTTALKQDDSFTTYSSEQKIKKAYRQGDIDGYLIVKQSPAQLTATFYGSHKLDNDTKTKVIRILNKQQQALNFSNAKLSKQQANALSQKINFTEKATTKKLTTSDKNELKTAAFWILILVLYFLVQTYSSIMAQDIAGEKGTKIMEMIFSSMPGGNYFNGKILGIFMEIITQLLIYIFMFTGFYYLASHIDSVKDSFNQIRPAIDQIIGQIFSWGLLFIVLGLIIFIVYAAVCLPRQKMQIRLYSH